MIPHLPVPVLAALLALCGFLSPAQADDRPQALVHLLGYIGVDYPATVAGGRVVNATEYAEQREFAARVQALVGRLPPSADRDALAAQARRLVRAIERRAPGSEVAGLTQAMRASVIRAYAVAIAPPRPPDIALGARLYAAHCAACHGAGGRGDGPAAAALTPRPADFHEAARQSQRSVYALYNTISLGVEGTAMRGYAGLGDAERWALAFYVSGFAAGDAERRAGAERWAAGEGRSVFPDLAALTQATPAAVAAGQGEAGREILAYLRAHPAEIGAASPLAQAERLLRDSLAAYQAGRREAAYELAVRAYLEGVEPVETGLAAVDPGLKAKVEGEMYRYRGMVQAGEPPAAVAAQAARLAGLLGQVRATLAGASLTPAVAFGSALVILLREGLEAILLLAAVTAFLVKTGRRDALRYLHAGWVAALALGLATWFAATYLIDISGANREVTEGLTGLLAAGVLFYVGIWLHNKLQAARWRAFIEAKVRRAVGGRTLWALALVSFVAVYREIFETVLFYEALWVQAGPVGHGMVLGGFAAAVLGLAALAWLIFRFSARLPLRLFFGVNSALMYVLAIVFAGKGVAALQEAGRLPVSPVRFPRLDLLGIYPNLEALSLQALLVAAAIVMVIVNRRSSRIGAAGR